MISMCCLNPFLARLCSSSCQAFQLKLMERMLPHGVSWPKLDPQCHTFLPGEAYNDAAQWSVVIGIFGSPESYPGLDASSGSEVCQSKHMEEWESTVTPCSKTCLPCHVTLSDEVRYVAVQRVMQSVPASRGFVVSLCFDDVQLKLTEKEVIH